MQHISYAGTPGAETGFLKEPRKPRFRGTLSYFNRKADTEAYEFQDIYNLETIVIPTHRPMVRKDRQDQVFRTAREKFNAILADIEDCHKRGQPVLVGTTSIENSELLAAMLQKEKLPHNVLNAKQHAREAEIVVQAGRPHMITIATNMAGRGTDIVLGGNVERQIDQLLARQDVSEADREPMIAALRSEWQQLHDQVIGAGGLCTSSAPSDTSRAASTTSCAAARADRAIRARRASICRWTIRCSRSSPATV